MLLLDIHLKEMQSLSQKDISTLIFLTRLLTIPETWKQTYCPWMDEWIKKIWWVCVYIYIYGMLFSHWKKILPLWQYRWKKPLSWVKQVRERQILCDRIYMWDIKLKKKKQLMNTGRPQRWHPSASVFLESISVDLRMCVKSDACLSGQYSKKSLFCRDWAFSRQLPLCWAWGWLSPYKACKDYFSVCYSLLGFRARCFGGSCLKCTS